MPQQGHIYLRLLLRFGMAVPMGVPLWVPVPPI